MALPVSVEELNKLLFEQSPDGIFIDDGYGYFVDVNSTLCLWLGYTKEEFLKFHISDLIGKEVLKSDPLKHDVLKAGKTVIKERQLICKSGFILPVELTARTLPNGNILVHVRDISVRFKAVKDLKESEEKYRRIIETASEGIWQMDHHFTTTFVNAKMAEMLGYESSEMIGEKVFSFMYEEDLRDHKIRMKKRQTGASDNYERRFRRKDGTELWTMVSATPLMNINGEFIGSFGMFSDITH